MDEKLSAVLTGLIGVTAVNVIRRDDDNNNRIRNQQDDLDSLSRRFRDFSSNGHILRQFMPTVADLLAGTALARSSEQAATLLPTLSSVSRPDLLSSMASAVKAFTWPPVEGEYTSNGYITKAGELTSLGLVLTYEEVRAFLHGLVLSSSPSTEAKGQAYGAASGLDARHHRAELHHRRMAGDVEADIFWHGHQAQRCSHRLGTASDGDSDDGSRCQ
jgi:hypothetical protein